MNVNVPDKPAGVLRLVPVKVAARYGNMSLSKVYELIGTGKIDARKDGRKTLVDLNSIDAHQKALPRAVITWPLNKRKRRG